ncbi:MAG: hypothetical protein AB7N65_19005 [Vicinamibacterales bacterium]
MSAIRAIVVFALLISVAGCSSGPGAQTLRDSFAEQLSANKFITDFKRSGDEMTFQGPTAEGGKGSWRVRIDSAVVEATGKDAQPYKGTVKSSWFIGDEQVRPSGMDSNLPIELVSNGLSQDCWALWDPVASRWGWE